MECALCCCRNACASLAQYPVQVVQMVACAWGLWDESLRQAIQAEVYPHFTGCHVPYLLTFQKNMRARLLVPSCANRSGYSVSTGVPAVATTDGSRSSSSVTRPWLASSTRQRMSTR